MKICLTDVCLATVALLTFGWLVGFRINLTDSMPPGLYLETKDIPSRGDPISFCLASNNDQAARYLNKSLLCPNGLQPLLKRLAALSGDRVDVRPEGLLINGQPVPESGIRKEDSKGRRLVSRLTSGAVPDGMALVLGDNAGSFDGRYFGFIPLRSCRRVIPILTFQKRRNLMEKENFDELREAADMVDMQSSENPTLGVPVDPDVADFMGAFYDPAAEADAESMEELDALEDEDAERS